MENITIKNYKCFDNDGATLGPLKDVNIIIGKNNSGKSSIIDVIRRLVKSEDPFFQSKKNNLPPTLIAQHKMTEELIRQEFDANTWGGSIQGYRNHQEYGLTFTNKILEYKIEESSKKFMRILEQGPDELLGANYFDMYTYSIPNSLSGHFFHLTAERDIRPEKTTNELKIDPNGTGATNFVQQVINNINYDSSLIEKVLLEELNKITNPDMAFSRILVQQGNGNIWEIYFENDTDGRIPLSKMGSGIKTILLVALMIKIQPQIDNMNISSCVFALEELENNLHPSQQRRLYYYLYEFSKNNGCKFFLTTHSNVVIDLYQKLENTQIIHVSRSDGKTSIKTIAHLSECNHILNDLDVKASDLLQSNSIIWVEGPSDRTYINKWLSLSAPSLIEGYHYSIMFYGGRLLANLTVDYENLQEELIPLLKLNRNCFVIMDRDGKSINTKVNETKKRISAELGEERVWITKGREIENYLSNESLQLWLKSHNMTADINNQLDLKIEDNLETACGVNTIKYNSNKSKYALEIVEFIDEGNWEVLDLKPNIDRIIDLIKRWNNE